MYKQSSAFKCFLLFYSSPDTFIYTTADQNGFLLPQNGANFVIRHTGKQNLIHF